MVPPPPFTLPSQLGRDLGSTPGMDGLQTGGADICFRVAGGPSTLTVYRSPLFFRAPRCPELGFPQPLYLFSPFLPQGPEAPPRIPEGAPCTLHP